MMTPPSLDATPKARPWQEPCRIGAARPTPGVPKGPERAAFGAFRAWIRAALAALGLGHRTLGRGEANLAVGAVAERFPGRAATAAERDNAVAGAQVVLVAFSVDQRNLALDAIG